MKIIKFKKFRDEGRFFIAKTEKGIPIKEEDIFINSLVNRLVPEETDSYKLVLNNRGDVILMNYSDDLVIRYRDGGLTFPNKPIEIYTKDLTTHNMEIWTEPDIAHEDHIWLKMFKGKN